MMIRIGVIVGLVLAMEILGFGSAPAQAVCDSAAAPTSSVCGPNNTLSWTIPVTNTDGTPLNNLSSFRVVFGPNAALCSPQGVPTVGSTVRDLGPLTIPPTPLPNMIASTKLGALAMPNGLLFATPEIVNAVATTSGCPVPVQFTFQGSTPPTPTGLKVN